MVSKIAFMCRIVDCSRIDMRFGFVCAAVFVVVRSFSCVIQERIAFPLLAHILFPLSPILVKRKSNSSMAIPIVIALFGCSQRTTQKHIVGLVLPILWFIQIAIYFYVVYFSSIHHELSHNKYIYLYICECIIEYEIRINANAYNTTKIHNSLNKTIFIGSWTRNYVQTFLPHKVKTMLFAK